MTIVELLGKERFYYEINGVSYKNKCVRLFDTEIFEEDFAIHVKRNGKTKVICENVGVWTIFEGNHIILTHDINNRSNDFRIVVFEGNTIISGGVSPDGYLYYFEKNMLLKEIPFSEETIIVKTFDFIPDTVEYDDCICILSKDGKNIIKQDYI
ncbi:MAG: hypothetical protein J6J52_04935 [Oscillospiraceae bacterium]|nr:hypothetical protein [Oscillospiraceae bacterium]